MWLTVFSRLHIFLHQESMGKKIMASITQSTLLIIRIFRALVLLRDEYFNLWPWKTYLLFDWLGYRNTTNDRSCRAVPHLLAHQRQKELTTVDACPICLFLARIPWNHCSRSVGLVSQSFFYRVLKLDLQLGQHSCQEPLSGVRHSTCND